LNLAVVDPDRDVIELFTRAANSEGEGAVELDELIARARHFKADRQVVGEIVHGADALEMIVASTGATNRSLSTLHADEPSIVVSRLSAYCQAHPSQPSESQVLNLIAQTIDVIVYLEQVPVNGALVRRVVSVTEVGDYVDGRVASSEIWSWDPATDSTTQLVAWSPRLLSRVRRRGLDAEVLYPGGDR
jgi:pilus assembly protein CpaF